MSWFYLALLAPFLFAIVNLIDDNLLRHVYKSPFIGSIIAGLFGAIPLLSLIFLPLSSVSIWVATSAIGAGFLTIIYYFFFFRALEVETPSVVIAMLSLSSIILPFLAHFFIGETLSNGQIAGFCLVLGASFGLALTEAKRFKLSRALLFSAVAAFLFAVASLLAKFSYQRTNFYTGYMFFSGGLVIGSAYLLIVIRFLEKNDFFSNIKNNSKKIIPLFLITEAIAILAELVQNLAISKGPVSLVNVISGTQPVYVLLIALLLFKFSPKYFREAAQGNLVKKFTLMGIVLMGLYLINAHS